MKRSPLARGAGLQRRTAMKRRRDTPRRREAPRWTFDEWVAQGDVLAVRSGGCCEMCRTHYGPFERHHRKRRRDGGDRLCNILFLCRDCHHHVTEHPAEARKFGWIVSVNRDPADIPVLWQKREWMTLTDDGAKVPLPAPVEDAHN